MTVADDILDLLKRKRRLRLTATDIAEMLYWEDKTYQHRVKANCSLLYEEGKLARDGEGSLADPYTYSIARLNGRPNREDHTKRCREPITGESPRSKT